MDPVIHLREVSKVYRPSHSALRPLTLDIKASEFVFIAGASGAGKSTLLKMLYLQEVPSTGELMLFGKNTGLLTNDESASLRREISIVFQDFMLLYDKSILENVALPLMIRGVRSAQAKEQAREMLSIVDVAQRVDATPNTLSGGEQQRVALARALIARPKLLIADEPTGNLDPEMSAYVFSLLEHAHQLGVTVVVATHNFAAIDRMKKRTLVLDQGRLIGDFAGESGARVLFDKHDSLPELHLGDGTNG